MLMNILLHFCKMIDKTSEGVHVRERERKDGERVSVCVHWFAPPRGNAVISVRRAEGYLKHGVGNLPLSLCTFCFIQVL